MNSDGLILTGDISGREVVRVGQAEVQQARPAVQLQQRAHAVPQPRRLRRHGLAPRGAAQRHAAVRTALRLYLRGHYVVVALRDHITKTCIRRKSLAIENTIHEDEVMH